MTHLLVSQLHDTLYIVCTLVSQTPGISKYWFRVLVAMCTWFDAIMLLINNRPQVVLGVVARLIPWAHIGS